MILKSTGAPVGTDTVFGHIPKSEQAIIKDASRHDLPDDHIKWAFFQNRPNAFLYYLVLKGGYHGLTCYLGTLSKDDLRQTVSSIYDLPTVINDASTEDAITILNLIALATGRDEGVSILMDSSQEARKAILNRIIRKEAVIKAITNIQYRDRRCSHIANQGYLAVFWHSTWLCSSCQEPYEDGVDVIAFCSNWRHSCHLCHVSPEQNLCSCGKKFIAPKDSSMRELARYRKPRIPNFVLRSSRGGMIASANREIKPDCSPLIRAPYLPAEIQSLIGAYLDPPTSANAVRGGLSVDNETYRRAQHAYAWSAILESDDLRAIEQATQGRENVVLLGKNLDELFSSFNRPKNTRSPLKLLMAWRSSTMIGVNKPSWYRLMPFTDKEYPEIHLQAETIPPWDTIQVSDLGDYITSNSGLLHTKAIYFHDEEWKLYTVEVNFTEGNSGTSERVYKYALKLDKLQEKELFLEQDESSSRPDRPREPWHLSSVT